MGKLVFDLVNGKIYFFKILFIYSFKKIIFFSSYFRVTANIF